MEDFGLQSCKLYTSYRPVISQQVVEIFRGSHDTETGFWGHTDCPAGTVVYKVFSAGKVPVDLAVKCPVLSKPDDVGRILRREFDKVVASKRSDHLEKKPPRRFAGKVVSMTRLVDVMDAKVSAWNHEKSAKAALAAARGEEVRDDEDDEDDEPLAAKRRRLMAPEDEEVGEEGA